MFTLSVIFLKNHVSNSFPFKFFYLNIVFLINITLTMENTFNLGSDDIGNSTTSEVCDLIIDTIKYLDSMLVQLLYKKDYQGYFQ